MYKFKTSTKEIESGLRHTQQWSRKNHKLSTVETEIEAG